MKVTSYRNYRYWEAYLRFFPATYRSFDEAAIHEEWWRWRDSDVHLDRYKPDASNKPGGRIILLHGGGGYSRLLLPYAESLRQRGFEVVVPDLPGFGLTRAAAEDIDYRSWVDLAVDLIAREAPDDLPLFVMGASLGGMVAYAAGRQNDRVSGIISTTLCDPQNPEVRFAFVRSRWMVTHLWPLASLVPEAIKRRIRLPIRWFGRMDKIAADPELSRIVSRDRLGGGRWLPLGFLDSIFRLDVASVEGELNLCPVLLAHPQNDDWTPLQLSDAFFKTITSEKHRVVLTAGGHFPVEADALALLDEAASHFLQEQSEGQTV